ncbi:hypothetical protein LUPAC06_02010 [Micromonospora saelicesensis]|nr:hypothetical protein LUPAC06_02010 [Micromonospora saelicesensis]
MLLPQPLGVAGEALVEPDVAPPGQRHAVAEPLVRQLVCDDTRVRPVVREEARPVDRPGLGLQRVPDPVVGDHDPPVRVERVGAEAAGQEVDDRTGAGQRGGRAAGRRQARGHRRDHRPAGVRAGHHPVVTDHERAQVAGHRGALRPAPGGPAVGTALRPGYAVAQRGQAVRDGHRQVVGGLVRRVVVDREPGGGRVGLAERHRAVGGVQETAAAQRTVVDRGGDARVLDGHCELPAARQSVAGRHHQLAVAASVLGRRVTHADRADLQADQVEVEPGQVLRGGGRDDGSTAQPVGRRVVADVEAVVPDVVTAIAVPRHVRVAGIGGTGPEAVAVVARTTGGGQSDRAGQRGDAQSPSGQDHAHPSCGVRPPAALRPSAAFRSGRA